MEENKEVKTTIDNPAVKKDTGLESRFANVAKTRGGTSFGDTTDVSDLDNKPTSFTDVNEVRGQRQSTLDKYKNGAIRMAGTAATSFAEGTVGALIGTTEALATGDFTKLYNNEFGQALDSMNESLAEAAPIYYTKEQQDSILNANFIPDKLFNGAGYMLGAIGSGIAGGKVLGAMGKLAMAGKLTPEALTAADAGATLINSAKGTRLINGTQEAVIGALSAHGESAAEARGARKDTYDKLIKVYQEKNGKAPEGQHLEEINRLSDAAGNVDYLTNLVVTGGTNMLQFGKLMTGGYKTESKALWEIVRDRAGKFTTPELGKVGKIARNLSAYTAGMGEETLQEGVQYATQIGTADYYSRKFDKKEWDSVGEAIKSAKDAFIGTINSKEGFESMLLGGILGAGGGVLHNDVSKKTQNTQEALAVLNDTKLESMVDKIGTAASLQSYEKDKAVALHNKDIFNFKNLQYDGFKTFVNSRVKYGQFDSLIDELNEQRDLTDEQFKEKFGFPADQPLPKSKEDIISELKVNAIKIKDISESIETKFPYNNTNGVLNDREYSILKEQLFHTSTTLDNVNKRVQEISGKVSMLGTPNNPVGIFNQSLAASNPEYLAQYINSIDNLIAEKKSLNPLDTSIDSLQSYGDDLVKLEIRRKVFIDHYNKLNNPETLKSTIDEVQTEAAQVATDTKEPITPIVDETKILEEVEEEETELDEEALNTIAEKVINKEELTEEETAIVESNPEVIEEAVKAKEAEIAIPSVVKETTEDYIKKPSSELVKGEKFFLEKDGVRYHFEKTESGVKRLEVTKADGSTPTQAEINNAFQFEANFNAGSALPKEVRQLGKSKEESVKKEKKVEKKPVIETSTLPITPLPIEVEEGEEPTYDEDIKGGHTLYKTTSKLRSELESKAELDANEEANLRFLNYVDNFGNNPEDNPRAIKFKVVTTNDPEYNNYIDKVEQDKIAELKAKNPNYVGVKFIVIDENNEVVLDKDSGLPLITSPLTNEIHDSNKVTGEDGKTYSISPKHFLRKLGVKDWKKGTNSKEFKAKWEQAVAEKNAFRKQLESGKIKQLNILERSPGVLDNEGATPMSPAGSVFPAEEINERFTGSTPRYYIATTPDKGSKYETITNKTHKGFGFLAQGETRELRVGTLYAIKDGVFYPLTPKNLNDAEVKNLVAAFAKLEKDNKPEIRINDISNYVFITPENKNYGENTLRYDISTKTIFFGSNSIPVKEATTSQEFLEFLSKRKRQVDTLHLKDNPQVRKLLDNGEFKDTKKVSYYELLFSDKIGGFTIKMNPHGERQVTNSYFVYDSKNPITELIKPVEETKSTVAEVIKPTNVSPEKYTSTEKKGIVETANTTTEEDVDSSEFEDFDENEFNDEEEALNRLAGNNKDYVKENIGKAKEWYKKQFGDTDLTITKKLIDGKAFGQFYKNITYLWENAEEGTLYHEAYHKVEEQYLTKEEVAKLHAETEKLVGKKLSVKEGKEIRAEDFRNYMLNGQKTILNNPVRNTFFRKLWRMIKNFVTNKKDIQSVYEKLANEGYSSDKKVRSSNSKLNRFGEFNESKSKEINDTITSLLFDNLFSNKKTPAELTDSDDRSILTGKAYNNVKAKLAKRYNEIGKKAKETGKLTAQEKEIFSTYKYLLNNWELVVTQHIKTLEGLINITVKAKEEKKDNTVAEERKVEENEEQEGETEVEEITKGKGNDWDSSNEIATISTASNNTKMLLATLKQRNADGSVVLNTLGEAKLLEFGDAYNFLLRNLKGLSSTQAMYSKIESLVSINPSMQSLIDRLPNPYDIPNLNNHELQLWLNFWQDFHKAESKGTTTILDKETGEIYQVDANRHNLEERLKDVWKADLAKSPYTIKSGSANTLKKEVIENIDTDEIEGQLEFLEAIGITFENWTAEEIENTQGAEFGKKVNYIRTMIADALEQGKAVNDLFDLASKEKKSKGNLTDLLKIASEKSTKNIELSYMTPDGKRIYSMSQPNYHSLVTDAINNANTWEELIDDQPQLNSVSSKGSVWLDKIFPIDSKTGLRGVKNPNAKLSVTTIAGIRIEGDSESGERITSADVATKFLQEFNDLFQTGKATIPRTSDKSTDQVAGLEKDRTDPLTVDTVDIAREGFKTSEVANIFVGTKTKPGYFLAELERIQLFNVDKLGSTIDIYNKKAGNWTIFEDILSPQTKAALEPYLKNKNIPTKSELAVVAKDVEAFLESIAIEGNPKYTTFPSVLDMMKKFKLLQNGKLVGVDKSIRKHGAETLARTFAVNHLIQTIEYHKVIAGDKAFYKDSFKRYSGMSATKLFCNSDGVVNAQINKNKQVNEFGFEYDVEDNVRAIVLADSNVRSNVAHEYIEATYRRLVDSGIAEEVAANEAALQHAEYGEKKGKGAMTEADAQAYSNPVFHRHMMIKSALWNFSKEEKQYQYEMAYMYVKLHERASETKAEQLKKYGKEYTKYKLSAESLTKYKAIVADGNPEYIINIQKGQYFGAQAGDRVKNLNAPTFHKYSIAPLTWRLVEGTNLEDHLINLLENKVGYMVFESGVKLGAPVKKDGSKPAFYNEQGTANILTPEEVKEIEQILPFKYLGIQVEIAPKAKEKVIFGTQFRKLFESNLFDNGTMQVPELGALHTKYLGLIKSLAEDEWNKLTKELGVKLDSNNNLESMNVTELVKLLRKESESRQLANNLVESLQTNTDGTLKYPIDSLVNRNKLESLMVALVSSRVIRQKMPGDAMIQMSNIGHEKKGKRDVAFSNDLQSYRKEIGDDGKPTGKTLPMQIKVSMNAQYKELLKKYGTIENVNKAIKSGDIPKEVLTLVGYRIPTQGLNSIEFMEIVGFTSDSQGNSIIMPSEIVAKSGGDFDIDKLNIFRPNFKYKGLTEFVNKEITRINKESESNYKKLTEEELDNIIDSEEDSEYNTVIKGIASRFKSDEIVYIKGDSKQGKQNEIISTAKQMLEHEYMFEQLVTANTTRDMDITVDAIRYAEYLATNPEKVLSKKEFLDKLKEYTPSATQELMVGHIMNQFRDFLGGKQAVGSDAVHITAHLLFQQAGTKIAADKVEINMDAHQDENKNYLLGKRYNKNGKLISDIFSQIANLHLDAAKDPKYKDINLTQEVLSTAHFLNHLGIPEDTIIYFIKQPVVLELLAAEKKILIDKLAKNEYINHAEALAIKYAKAAGIEIKKMFNPITKQSTEEIGDYPKAIIGTEITNEELLNNIAGNINPLLQLQVVQDFVRYRDYSRNLGSFMKSVNYDTIRFKNLSAIQDRLDLVEGIRKGENRLFTGADYDAIMNNTIVGSFDKTKGTKNMYSHLFVTQDADVSKVRKSIIEEVSPRTGSPLADRLPSMIDNDFIGYITQRFGMYQGKKLYTHIDRLFKGKNSLARQLESLKGVIGDNYLIEQLQGILKDDVDNISIYTRKLTKHESDVLTDLYRELSEYDGAEAVKVHEFMNDLTTFGILQSGLHNSPITFLSLIPNELYGDITKNAIEAYKKYGGNDPAGKKAILEDFTIRFYLKNANNSQIVPNAKDFKGETIKKNANRFFSQVEETQTVKDADGKDVKEKTGKITLYQKGKEFKLAGVEFRKFGHRLQDFYLQDNDELLETPKAPSEDTKTPIGTFNPKVDSPFFDDSEEINETSSKSTATKEGIERVEMLLKGGMPIKDIIDQQLTHDLSEQELNELKKSIPSMKTTNTQAIRFEEEPSSGYRERTMKNASADATIAIAVDFNSAGEKLTKSSVLNQGKKYIPIDATKTLKVSPELVNHVVDSLNQVNAKSLNIAGNGLYTMKGKYSQEEIDTFVYELLKNVLDSPRLTTKIESIRSGGQTGFDEAGTKAGIKLGLPTLTLAPKGWKFRDINGSDISNEKQFKARFEGLTQSNDSELDNMNSRIENPIC